MLGPSKNMSILYLSYDGILEPLGHSQVLCYIQKLSKTNKILLISYEKNMDINDRKKRSLIKKELEGYDISWFPLTYHKKPPILSTAYDLLRGICLAIKLSIINPIRVVHARGYPVSIIALFIKYLFGVKYLFDMRGFWPDEKLESGWNAKGVPYKVTKIFEKLFLLSADHIISLTNAGSLELQKFPYLKGKVPPITVIPTCADLKIFKVNKTLNKKNKFTVGYIGTASNWYLFEETALCFALILEEIPKASFLILNRGDHNYIEECLSKVGIKKDSYKILECSRYEVPKYLSELNASVFFIKPVFSKKASAPTKLAELLGCGIPCLTNTGVGDMDSIIEHEKVGTLIRSFDIDSIKKAIKIFLSLALEVNIQERCHETAEKYFCLEQGASKLNAVYESLAKFK